MGRQALLSLCLCLALFHGCLAYRQQPRPLHSRHQLQHQQGNECQIDNFQALEPQNRVECEAGLIETWDQNEEQLQCAGATMVRYTIEPNGLLLPSFSSTPMLMYIVQGKGLHGMVVPGCPETFQSMEEPQQAQQEHSQSFEDQHQKIRRIRQGDVVAMLAGVSYWMHNDDTQNELVVVALFDTNNSENQLDSNPRKFYLAGNPQDAFQGHQKSQGTCNNVFCGFDAEVLAEAFNVDTELVRKIQSQNDNRKNIVKVDGKLQMIRPRWSQEEEEPQMRRENGMEETICAMSIKQNIGNPSSADIFTPQAGWISTVNSNNLPILRWIQLSAAKGVLYKNSMMAPRWNMNAHSIIYVIRGSARMQVVDNNGNAVFDDEVTEGQVVTVPQNFAVVQRTENKGFEWVAFKTNENAMMSTLAGKTSVMRGLPVQVIANSYQISPEEARRLKFNRMETEMFNLESSPRTQIRE